MPRFTIVIACRDAAARLPATLAALRAQDFTNWEAICVEDSSSDDTAEVVARVARVDPRIRLVRCISAGPGFARNLGALVEARGEIVTFLEAGDLWVPTRLRALDLLFSTRADIDVALTGVSRFATDPAMAEPAPHAALDIAALLSGHPEFSLSNIALRAAALRIVGGFDIRMKAAEDLEWAVRLLAADLNIARIDSPLALLRCRKALGPAAARALQAAWHEAVETARILGIAPSAAVLARAEAAMHRRITARLLRGGPESEDSSLATALRMSAAGFLRSPAAFLRRPVGAAPLRAAS